MSGLRVLVCRGCRIVGVGMFLLVRNCYRMSEKCPFHRRSIVSFGWRVVVLVLFRVRALGLVCLVRCSL